MKINSTWSQKDWDDALKKVWKLSRDFEEILNFGLEHGFITSSDIIHASDIYKDPYKEYDDDDIKEMIRSRGLSDIVDILEDEYSTRDILDEFTKNEILDEMDDDDLLDHIEHSYTLEQHDNEVREIYYRECIDEWLDELSGREKEKLDELRNCYPDDLHQFICDLIGVGYYDKEGLMKGLENLKDKLNKNSYGIKYET